MTRVIINGSKGRMGQALLSCGESNPDIEIAAGIDVGDSLADVIAASDAVIEFSFHEITRSVAELCAEHKKALVIGTTGHTAEDKEAILSCRPRFCVGVQLFHRGEHALWLTRKATEVLGTDFDLEVVEMHHRRKRTPQRHAATL